MCSSAHYVSPSEAARHLGVSVKALRLYEQHGLVSLGRTASGWRTYGPADMERAKTVVTLRGLGLGLVQIKHALAGPANHSPPTIVTPYLGAPGYETVATCLASPEVRARTEGGIACRPHQA